MGARIGARFQGLDARLYYYSANNIGAGTTDQTAYNFEVDYVFQNFDVSGSFGSVENKPNTGTAAKDTADYWQLSGGFQANDKTYVAIGYDAKSHTSTANNTTDSSTIYANVSYALHKNAKVYGEIGTQDTGDSAKESDTGYLVGMEVRF